MRDEICCRRPETLQRGASPFTRIVALDFYDGPTGGVLQCEPCAAVYKFDMLDWDDEHKVRIFRLYPLPVSALTELIATLGKSESPRWPIWFPKWVWSSDEARKAAERVVEQVLARAEPAAMIVAWNRDENRILAAASLAQPELADATDWFSQEGATPARDWFKLLGLSRTPSKSPAA